MAEIAMVVKLTAAEGKVDELLEAVGQAGRRHRGRARHPAIRGPHRRRRSVGRLVLRALRRPGGARRPCRQHGDGRGDGRLRRPAGRAARDARAVDRPGQGRRRLTRPTRTAAHGDVPRPHPRRTQGGRPSRRPGPGAAGRRGPGPVGATGLRGRAAGGRGDRDHRRGQAPFAVQGRPRRRPRPGRAGAGVRAGRGDLPVGAHRSRVLRRLARRPARRPGRQPPPGAAQGLHRGARRRVRRPHHGRRRAAC